MNSLPHIKRRLEDGLILARRNIGLQVRQHALGFGWTILTPAIYAVFYILVKLGLQSGAHPDSGTGFAWDVMRMFSGISLAQIWFQLLQDIAATLRANRGFLRGLDVSPTPFVLASAFEAMVNGFIRLLIILLALLVLGLSPPLTFLSWISIILAFTAIITTAIAIGLILAPWSALYADVQKTLASAHLPLILISPIFYPAVENIHTVIFWLNSINPIAPPAAIMVLALQGVPFTDSNYAVPLLIQLLVSLGAIVLFLKRLPKALPIVLERIGS